MQPYTPVHPPTLVRKRTSFGGDLRIDLNIPGNQTAILEGRYFPIQWHYTGDPEVPDPLDIIYPFLPPATSMTLSLSCQLDNASRSFTTIYDDCCEVLVYGYRTEPYIADTAVPKSMEADNDYIAACWSWGIYTYDVWPTPVDPLLHTLPFQQMLTFTGPANYWGMLVRPGIVDFLGPNDPRHISIRAQAELGISTYPTSNSIRINQPYCVPPFQPLRRYIYPIAPAGSYLFYNAPVAPRPRSQNAAAVRHFESRMMLAEKGYKAHFWGGPWKIDAVASVEQAALPPDITIALEDHTHTPEAAVDRNAYYSPTIASVTGTSGRVFADFVTHPVVTISHNEIVPVDIAAGVCVQGGI